MTDELKPSPEAARYLADRFQWAAPGDQQHDAWLVRFCDQDCRDAVFTGPDAEAEAWAYWNRYAPAFNIYVFRLAALRPATMPEDVVEAVERAIQDQANPGFGVSDQSKRQATAALTAMQPAIQAAVEALEKIAADDERPSHPCDGPSYGHFGSIATKALATLRAKEVSDHG